MSCEPTKKLAPVRLRIAVIDHENPRTYNPFTKPLSNIESDISNIVETLIDENINRDVRITLILRHVRDINVRDTRFIIGAFVDGTEFNGSESCPALNDRRNQLRSLCGKIRKHAEPKWRELGFSLWLVCKEDQPMNFAQMLYLLSEPIQAQFGIPIEDINRDFITNNNLFEHVARTVAMEAAITEPFSKILDHS